MAGADRSQTAVAATSTSYFFSGVAGVTGQDPPVDFGPGVTPAAFSVDPAGSLAIVALVFGLAPVVGPLPASFADAAPLVGPLPASDRKQHANAGARGSPRWIHQFSRPCIEAV